MRGGHQSLSSDCHVAPTALSTSCSLACHCLATLGAAAADVGAVLHPVEPVAAFGAGSANFGALAANMGMMRRAARHEVGGGRANLGAVEHQPHVRRLYMSSTHFEAVRRGHLQAGHVAGLAGVDAVLHLG